MLVTSVVVQVSARQQNVKQANASNAQSMPLHDPLRTDLRPNIFALVCADDLSSVAITNVRSFATKALADHAGKPSLKRYLAIVVVRCSILHFLAARSHHLADSSVSVPRHVVIHKSSTHAISIMKDVQSVLSWSSVNACVVKRR